jgi:hypothetical protein
MESRVARLEVRVEHIERDLASLRQTIEYLQRRLDGDFRITWAGIIASNLGLAGMMAKGFGWL